MAAPTQELRPLTGFEPESLGGVRLFHGVKARGRDILDWAAANPGALDGSKWVECDLDDTEWPHVVRDITIVDSSLRNSVWDLEDGVNIRIVGTKRIPLHVDMQTEQIVYDAGEVMARVDGMHVNGKASGFSLFRVAGFGVTFGTPEADYFEHTAACPHCHAAVATDAEHCDKCGESFVRAAATTPPLGGQPFQGDNTSIQLSVLGDSTFYVDGEDSTLHRNGFINLRLGGRGRRFDISWNLMTGARIVGQFIRLNAQRLVAIAGSAVRGTFTTASFAEATLVGRAEGDFDGADFDGASIKRFDMGGVFGKLVGFTDTLTGNLRSSLRKTVAAKLAQAPTVEVGVPGEAEVSL